MATALTKSKPMTADEFYDFVHRPGNAARFFELERGKVIETPPPGRVHGFVCSMLAWLLTNYSIERGRGYVCTNDTGVIVEVRPDTVRGADVSFYDEEGDTRTMERRYGVRPPLVVAEVISPNDKPGLLLRRISEYLKPGVRLLWVVDPEARTVTVYRKGREPLTLRESDELSGEDILKGFRSPVANLFKSPAERKGRSRRNGRRRS
jgi:Uma2 family endonuclease